MWWIAQLVSYQICKKSLKDMHMKKEKRKQYVANKKVFGALLTDLSKIVFLMNYYVLNLMPMALT